MERNLCRISKSSMKHQQNSDLPRIDYGYQKCLFVDFFNEYMVCPFVFIIECTVVNKIWRRSPFP